jgi:site-specific recombinase XerC
VTGCSLPELLNSWQITLLSQHKSPATSTSHQRAMRLYLEWGERNGHPKEITCAQVQAYTAELIEDVKEANTVRLQQAALRAFTRWLVEEGEIPDDPLLGLKAPKIPSKVVKGLTDDQLRALLDACKGAKGRCSVFGDHTGAAIDRYLPCVAPTG